MTCKNAGIVLLALAVAAVLPFGTLSYAEAASGDAPFSGTNPAEALEDRNPREKTLERAQEKEDLTLTLKKITELDAEEKDLQEKLKAGADESERKRFGERIGEIKSELDEIERSNHDKDIPRAKLDKLAAQRNAFEENLLNSTNAGNNTHAIKFVTSIGIDIASQEIQIGLNKDIANSTNIDQIVDELKEMMPHDADWHVVYSTVAEPLACDQTRCTPIIGGNHIIVTGGGEHCSFGFQAKKGSLLGWITAGHCADGKLGRTVTDSSGASIGTVHTEKFYWGTYCDCAWITTIDPSVVDNKVFAAGIHTITKTTTAHQQQNDSILKTGYAGGADNGIVSAVDVTVIHFWEDEYVRGLVRSNAVFEHGDSGGTVVELTDNGDLYGIATTYDWWGRYHTPINQITSEMGVTPVFD